MVLALLLLLQADAAELLKRLGSDDVDARDRAQAEFVKLGPRALPDLEAAARDADAERRGRIFRVIREIRLRDGVGPALLAELPGLPGRALSDSAEAWRGLLEDLAGLRLELDDEVYAVSLVPRKAPSATRRAFVALAAWHLDGAWRDDDVQARLWALSETLAIELPPALRAARADFLKRHPRQEAGVCGTVDDPFRRVEGAEKALSDDPAVAVPALLAFLEHERERVRAGAAERLADLGADDAAPKLASRLGKEPAAQARAAIARALGRIGDEDAALLRAAADDSADVRRAAFEALGRRGTKDAVPVLLKALDDPAAIEALGRLRAGADALRPKLRDAALLAAAVEALGRLGDAASLDAIRARLDDISPEVRHRAAVALLRLGDRDVLKAPHLLCQRRDCDVCLLRRWRLEEASLPLSRLLAPDAWRRLDAAALPKGAYRGPLRNVAAALASDGAVTIEARLPEFEADGRVSLRLPAGRRTVAGALERLAEGGIGVAVEGETIQLLSRERVEARIRSALGR
jgi:HEAT repeat protein